MSETNERDEAWRMGEDDAKRRMRSFPCIGGGADGRYLIFDHPPKEHVLNVGTDIKTGMPIQQMYIREKLITNGEEFICYRPQGTSTADTVCRLFLNYKRNISFNNGEKEVDE